jgi:hypothetical protein
MCAGWATETDTNHLEGADSKATAGLKAELMCAAAALDLSICVQHPERSTL